MSRTTTPVPLPMDIDQAVKTLLAGAHTYERHDDYRNETYATILAAAASILADLRPVKA
jgi:hypothetical protein